MNHTIRVNDLSILLLKVINVQVMDLVKSHYHSDQVFDRLFLFLATWWKHAFLRRDSRVSHISDRVVIFDVPPALLRNVEDADEVSVCKEQVLRLAHERLINLHVARDSFGWQYTPFFFDCLKAVFSFLRKGLGYLEADARTPNVVYAVDWHGIIHLLPFKVDVVEVKVDVVD